MSTRDDISKIIGFYIGKGEVKSKMKDLDRAGKFTGAISNALLVYILERLDQMDKEPIEKPY